MYQNQSYSCGCCGPKYGGLEKLAGYQRPYSSGSRLYESNGSLYHSAVSEPGDYGAGMFVPLISQTMPFYGKNTSYFNDNKISYGVEMPRMQAEYHFIPDDFLNPEKVGRFVGRAEEVREFVEEAFEKMFDQPFPEDIKISVLDLENFRKIAPHPSTIGLSLNRRKHGQISEVFILNDNLGRVMLTIGHELGHVLTPALESPLDEEAKAYAFSLEWMKAIKKHNIANLKEAIITENPAHNGLHNVAFSFVNKMLREGNESREVYQELIEKKLSLGTALFN